MASSARDPKRVVRIENVTIPSNKHVRIALTAIYGIGINRATELCESVEVSPHQRISSLSDEDIERLRDAVKNADFIVEGNLRREVATNIKRLKDIRSYRGARHKQGLPVRGQKTKTNARTRKKRKS